MTTNPETLNELALFAGAGGGILGGILCGFRTVCAVEWDAYARDVLVARQNDGCLETFPIWDDVQTFDGRPWRGVVDVVSGGFPCQDISAAGKGAGLDGERSGMWKEMARIIGEVLPRFVLVENSPMLVGRGLAVVLADLAQMGYDAEWGFVGAHHAGAPHKRDRIWIVATHARHWTDSERAWGPRRETGERQAIGGESDGNGQAQYVADAEILGRGPRLREDQPERNRNISGNCGGHGEVPDTGGERGQLSAERKHATIEQPWSDGEARSSGGIAGEWWATEPDVGGKTDGVATKLDGGEAHD